MFTAKFVTAVPPLCVSAKVTLSSLKYLSFVFVSLFRQFTVG